MCKKIKFPLVYSNGNYQVHLHEDGTKIRVSVHSKEFCPNRPETIDINISNYCKHNCPFCYIDAGIDKPHGDLELPILKTIMPGTEIAINFANHPGLIDFLYQMEKQSVIVNMTVNQKDLEDVGPRMLIQVLINSKLIMGVGVSINSMQNFDKIHKLNSDNIVYHIIVGVTPITVIEDLIKNKCKILFLGYKTKGRGSSFTPTRMEAYQENIARLMLLNDSIFSFDNLALDQLNIKDIVTEDVWELSYMGEEGQFSMYLDTVGKKYYLSSNEENGNDINNDDIKTIFKKLREEIK